MLICFDLETTGTNSSLDKIIEISMIKFDEETFEILDKYNSLVDPEIPIPEIISNICNIFDEDVVGAPKIAELREEIIDFIGDSTLLGHNVDFDIDFFVKNGINIEKNPKLDTFYLANFLDFKSESLNLGVLCKNYGISLENAHRAENDVMATIELFKQMLQKFKKYKKNQKILLQYIFQLSSDSNVKILGRFLGLDNSKKLGIETFEKIILDKIGIEKTKENIEITENSIVDNVDIFKFFNFGKNFETRENQLKMAKTILDILDKNEKILIEAPTGIGKSFAYLIPSILYAKNNNTKVYVSTNTKTLQDQLFEKDLKFLKEHLDLTFNYTKLKGKSNYLSLKGFFDYVSLGDFEYKEIGFLAKISLWLLETKYGELDELNYFPNEYYIKNELSSDRYDFKKKNPYKEYEFLEKARKSIEFSDIVVVNHSLLFSDLENENPILTKLENVVIDEAHNIEDTATEILKKKYNFRNFIEVVQKIEKIFTLKNISKIEFLQKKESIFSKLELVNDFGESYLSRKVPQEQVYKNILIEDDFYEEIDFSDLLRKINLEIIGLIDLLKCEENHDFSREVFYLDSTLEILNVVLKNSTPDKIKILTKSENYGVTFEYTVLNPGNYLKTNFWDNLKTCILTSATLSISNSFDYIKNILRLDDFEFLKFESDFDYKKQATLFIPIDLGNVKNNNKATLEFLSKFYEIVGGNTLTLFTSFASIKEVYLENNINLKKKGINLFAQSIGGSKTKILNQFLSDPNNSIILGTDSFWEGVDISGGNLKYLLIYKLPFSVPTDPIFLARSKHFLDPFLEYSVPKAIIKLKQGFGRLIRSKKDKGIVILLDNRINTTWGKAFYSAFPENINIKNGNSQQFLEVLDKKV